LDKKIFTDYRFVYQTINTDTIRTERVFELIDDQKITWKTGLDTYILDISMNTESDTFGIIDGFGGKVISRPLYANDKIDPQLIPVLFQMAEDTNTYVIYRKELKKVELIVSPNRILKLLIGEVFSEFSNKDLLIDSFMPQFLMQKGEKAELRFKQPIISEKDGSILFENKLLLRATYISDTIYNDINAKVLKSERYNYDQKAFVRLRDMIFAENDSMYIIDDARVIFKYKVNSDFSIIDPLRTNYLNPYDFMDEPKDPFLVFNVARLKKLGATSLIYHTQWKSNSDYQVSYVNGFPIPYYENSSFQGEISYLELDGVKSGVPFTEEKAMEPGQIRNVYAQNGKLYLEIEMRSKGNINLTVEDVQNKQSVEIHDKKAFAKGRKIYVFDIPMLKSNGSYRLKFIASTTKKNFEQNIDFIAR